jgi:hypothetical protein
MRQMQPDLMCATRLREAAHECDALQAFAGFAAGRAAPFVEELSFRATACTEVKARVG